jgi:hypothetical protein
MCECMLGSAQRYEMYRVHNVNALESLIYTLSGSYLEIEPDNHSRIN